MAETVKAIRLVGSDPIRHHYYNAMEVIMSNPIFQQMSGQMPQNNMSGLMQRFQQFRQQFQGDPRQQVQNLLNSGKVTQNDYNRAVQMAQQLQRMMGIK